MKTLLIASALVASMSSAAYSKTIVEYQYVKSATSNEKAHAVSVEIADDGDMDIAITEAAYHDQNKPAHNLNTHLNQSNRHEIFSLAQSLSNAKVVTIVNKFICYTYVMPIPMGPQSLKIATGFDYVSNEFNGELRLVQTPSPCYVRSHTSFVAPADTAKANRLQGMIEAAANNAIEDAGIH